MNRLLKSTIILVITFIVAITMVSCSKDSRKEEKILLLLKTLDNQYFDEIKKGVLDEWGANDSSVEIVIRAGTKESDIATQREVLDSYISQYAEQNSKTKLKAVILTPSASGDELTDYIRRLNDNNIPVVLLDTRINNASLVKAGAHYDAFIGSSNEDGGKLAMDLMIKYLPNGGKLLLLNGVEGHESAVARRKGFKARLTEKKAYKHVLLERTANWRRDEARKVVEGLFTLGEEIDGIFAANDEMALGAYEAIRTTPSRKDDHPVVIIGFDAIDPAKKSVDAGELTDTIQQDPYAMGKAAIVSLRTIWSGGKVDLDQVIPVKKYRRDN